MLLKKELRKELSAKRKAINDKANKDKQICGFLCESDYFNRYKLILFYSALADEVNLSDAIELALKNGASVAFPYCTDKNGSMEFYQINSIADLKVGSFGILEPDINICKRLTDFSDALCLVPAISFDKRGYRLGYGKGYYDRFLSKYSVFKVGICYDELLVDNLPINEYDIAVDALITEKGFNDII